jgi:hypothetical protein
VQEEAIPKAGNEQAAEAAESERDRTQPALARPKKILGDKYVFKTQFKENSRNPDDLVGSRQVDIG